MAEWGQGWGQGGALTAAPDGRIDPVAFATRMRDKVAASPLNGQVPAWGPRFGISTGSPDEWSRFWTMVQQQESGHRIGQLNPDGSVRRFATTPAGEQSYGPGQFKPGEYGLKTWADVNNPEKVADAYIQVAQQGKVPAYFGSVQRPNETLQHSKWYDANIAPRLGPQSVGAAFQESDAQQQPADASPQQPSPQQAPAMADYGAPQQQEDGGFLGNLTKSMRSPLFLTGASVFNQAYQPGGNVGAGIMGGIQASQQAANADMQNMKMQREMDRQKQTDQFWNQLRGPNRPAWAANIPPEMLGLAAGLPPDQAATMLAGHIGEINKRNDPLYKLTLQKAQRDLDTPADNIRTLKDGEAMYRVNPRTGQTELVAGNNDTDKPYKDAAGKQTAEIHKGFIEEGQKSVAASADLQRMQELNNIVGTGKLSSWLPTAGPWLQSIGVDIKGQGEAEAFQAIASKMAPNMRPSGSGSTSDRDMGIFMSSLPQLSQTPEGRQMVLDQMKGFHAYNQARAQIASDSITNVISPKRAQELIQRLPSPFEIMKARAKDLPPAPAPGQQAGQASSGTIAAGSRARNPKTGQEIIFDGKQWVPASQAPQSQPEVIPSWGAM